MRLYLMAIQEFLHALQPSTTAAGQPRPLLHVQGLSQAPTSRGFRACPALPCPAPHMDGNGAHANWFCCWHVRPSDASAVKPTASDLATRERERVMSVMSVMYMEFMKMSGTAKTFRCNSPDRSRGDSRVGSAHQWSALVLMILLYTAMAVAGSRGQSRPAPDSRSCEERLRDLLKSETFCAQVAEQAQKGPDVKYVFSGELFQPVPWSPTTKHGMPQEYEKYLEDKEQYAIINVPPNFMFQAKAGFGSITGGQYHTRHTASDIHEILKGDVTDFSPYLDILYGALNALYFILLASTELHSSKDRYMTSVCGANGITA
ncbi:hypothetical protein AXG93_3857s1220 [Marchantia polymorpha subsp. ruderalis]|uniref:Uncharacterized protein n=1 Tax=Marchantia polymorpha subsp. ruderalis TaxID=1480154 RepID=A0A176W3A4_MARPO|nr:hypothetical protein AXG93_3857s1220 [Marchantia polymorpha subsp. ruderalis]